VQIIFRSQVTGCMKNEKFGTVSSYRDRSHCWWFMVPDLDMAGSTNAFGRVGLRFARNFMICVGSDRISGVVL